MSLRTLLTKPSNLYTMSTRPLVPTDLSAQLKCWSQILEPCSDSARLDAEILLKYVSGLSDAQLISRSNEPLDAETTQCVDELVKSRQQGSPIAYLTGQREFYALNLCVDRNVLIPRPETELLVDTALDLVRSVSSPGILDLGTGSGAIALAIAANAPKARLIATDIDEKALQLAARNARDHNINTIKFLRSDWYTKVKGQHFDLIVSNPPYIDPDDPHLVQSDVRFEPQHALISADRGRADLRKIIEQAPDYLHARGWIALEHGYDQGVFARDLFEQQGFTDITTLKDLNLHDRVTLGCWLA
jgi:release factor glutamine methyltransferase